MRSLKGAIFDWITPRGQPLNPSLACNIKSNRGFNHERTATLLCPVSLNWSDMEWFIDFHFCSNCVTESKRSYKVVNWQFLETNGLSLSTKTSTIWKTHGIDYFKKLHSCEDLFTSHWDGSGCSNCYRLTNIFTSPSGWRKSQELHNENTWREMRQTMNKWCDKVWGTGGKSYLSMENTTECKLCTWHCYIQPPSKRCSSVSIENLCMKEAENGNV